LSAEQNKAIAQRSQNLTRQFRNSAEDDAVITPLLAELRQILLGLVASDELIAGLRRVMDETGLRWPENWEEAWMRIKQVWASKWNDRAYWSRQAVGIAHEDLSMAVLIQEVIEAQYAFVIHTANPINGNADEIFAEIVLGLGETLVGNYPGRAMSLICDKRTGKQTVLAYPGKSVALYSSGLIFRSDSNGEDLTDYAGAGLYDSVLLHPPRETLLDYTQEPLVWDGAFQKKLFDSILETGRQVERAFGSAQDIEGAFAQGQCYVVQSRPQVQVERIDAHV
jgi:alpha-glucan,water dikinase